MRIAVLDDYQSVAHSLADWDSLGASVTFFNDTIGGDALIERLKPFEIVCLMRERTPFPAEIINALPVLKLIVTTGPRNASIDLAAAQARGITICGTRSRKPATAHHTMSLILAATRGLVAEAISMRNSGWQVGLGRDLDGLTLGLVGLGKLGGDVAQLAKPFGMDIVAWSTNLTAERCAEVGVRQADTLEALLGQADVVSIHLVLSDRSRGLIGASQLTKMKPDAILVNASRGPIVDQAAALTALRADRLGNYACDVYSEEPVAADDPVRDRDLIDRGKLLLTPHIGYVGKQTYEIFYPETVAAIAAWQAGSPVGVLG